MMTRLSYRDALQLKLDVLYLVNYNTVIFMIINVKTLWKFVLYTDASQ